MKTYPSATTAFQKAVYRIPEEVIALWHQEFTEAASTCCSGEADAPMNGWNPKTRIYDTSCDPSSSIPLAWKIFATAKMKEACKADEGIPTLTEIVPPDKPAAPDLIK